MAQIVEMPLALDALRNVEQNLSDALAQLESIGSIELGVTKHERRWATQLHADIDAVRRSLAQVADDSDLEPFYERLRARSDYRFTVREPMADPAAAHVAVVGVLCREHSDALLLSFHGTNPEPELIAELKTELAEWLATEDGRTSNERWRALTIVAA